MIRGNPQELGRLFHLREAAQNMVDSYAQAVFAAAMPLDRGKLGRLIHAQDQADAAFSAESLYCSRGEAALAN